ncbi:uncharacterized protein BO66DRAFT_452472 [Aspergillus aculeatinus CBS 121060]|uniref:Uncharacterized protein n=1 Tax=Aspergillus aculeatinus CBS 121060 TaxID=1448322 RepID=A0ACD1H8X7_9EURO|nr:hypothetical protein BO66DRAFT_452472 [Aspergillus aculeatinus CBS 121060]RAH69883.1 hypothetical protein BO66DRAFT_452472 [Aspergillus aculeatinus CBS 121060]
MCNPLSTTASESSKEAQGFVLFGSLNGPTRFPGHSGWTMFLCSRRRVWGPGDAAENTGQQPNNNTKAAGDACLWDRLEHLSHAWVKSIDTRPGGVARGLGMDSAVRIWELQWFGIRDILQSRDPASGKPRQWNKFLGEEIQAQAKSPELWREWARDERPGTVHPILDHLIPEILTLSAMRCHIRLAHWLWSDYHTVSRFGLNAATSCSLLHTEPSLPSTMAPSSSPFRRNHHAHAPSVPQTEPCEKLHPTSLARLRSGPMHDLVVAAVRPSVPGTFLLPSLIIPSMKLLFGQNISFHSMTAARAVHICEHPETLDAVPTEAGHAREPKQTLADKADGLRVAGHHCCWLARVHLVAQCANRDLVSVTQKQGEAASPITSACLTFVTPQVPLEAAQELRRQLLAFLYSHHRLYMDRLGRPLPSLVLHQINPAFSLSDYRWIQLILHQQLKPTRPPAFLLSSRRVPPSEDSQQLTGYEDWVQDGGTDRDGKGHGTGIISLVRRNASFYNRGASEIFASRPTDYGCPRQKPGNPPSTPSVAG